MNNYPEFDADSLNKAFFEWKKHKKENIMIFRGNGYKSALTNWHHGAELSCSLERCVKPFTEKLFGNRKLILGLSSPESGKWV